MDSKEIMAKVDHTLLLTTATKAEIRQTLDDAMHYGAASACIPPSFVAFAKEYVGNRLPICTVIGFPNGYMTSAVKLYEAQCALADGADELDMVVNVSWIKDGLYAEVAAEIAAMKKVTGDKILKVIIETCLLTDDEKRRMCEVVRDSGADFIKTSTGFSTGGATFEDIALFVSELPKGFGIKAAGGIQTLADAERFLELGATRLGTSRIVKLLKNQDVTGY